LIGTYVNTGAILTGGLFGLVIGKRLPERIKTTFMQGLGLSTILIGVQMALNGNALLIATGCLLAGAVTGEILKMEQRAEAAGEFLKVKINADSPTFVKGFVSSSLLYLTGAMMIVGCIQDGASADPRTLYLKSLLDGFISIALAATLGAGVVFSALSVLLVQGAVTLLASYLVFLREPGILNAVASTGGFIVVGIGFNLMNLTELRVGNFIPAIVYAIIWAFFFP
jgi:uncharacterized membrane protein YqgA involved in biofilm formation